MNFYGNISWAFIYFEDCADRKVSLINLVIAAPWGANADHVPTFNPLYFVCYPSHLFTLISAEVASTIDGHYVNSKLPNQTFDVCVNQILNLRCCIELIRSPRSNFLLRNAAGTEHARPRSVTPTLFKKRLFLLTILSLFAPFQSVFTNPVSPAHWGQGPPSWACSEPENK